MAPASRRITFSRHVESIRKSMGQRVISVIQNPAAADIIGIGATVRLSFTQQTVGDAAWADLVNDRLIFPFAGVYELIIAMEGTAEATGQQVHFNLPTEIRINNIVTPQNKRNHQIHPESAWGIEASVLDILAPADFAEAFVTNNHDRALTLSGFTQLSFSLAFPTNPIEPTLG